MSITLSVLLSNGHASSDDGIQSHKGVRFNDGSNLSLDTWAIISVFGNAK